MRFLLVIVGARAPAGQHEVVKFTNVLIDRSYLSRNQKLVLVSHKN
jgi:hypothetical protein